MRPIIGIRYEDKYTAERRVPIIPKHVKRLVEEMNIDVHVVTSGKRVFRDDEYVKSGARLVDQLVEPRLVFGVKEIPEHLFLEGRTYVFFSHVIKGQKHNMPMLRKMMEMGCSLIDYEKVTDEAGKRLIFFGKFAGYAGMINTLWSAGKRLNEFGIKNPFDHLTQAHHYKSLDEARSVITEIGFEIARNGFGHDLHPFVVGITGYGNVSGGVQEILNLLPSMEISPAELLRLESRKDLSNKLIYKVIFKESDLFKHKTSKDEFDLQDYYAHPDQYNNNFEHYLSHLSLLLNTIYWDARYPRIVTKKYISELFSKGEPKLSVIGDISCDPNGSVEITHKGTMIEDPVFVYNHETGNPTMGFKGKGVLVMAVDILPSELPRESSEMFSGVLFSYLKELAHADFDVSFEQLRIPNPLKRALILHKGKLTPDYKYLEKYI